MSETKPPMCETCGVALERQVKDFPDGKLEFLECPQCKGAMFDRNTYEELRRLFTGTGSGRMSEPKYYRIELEVNDLVSFVVRHEDRMGQECGYVSEGTEDDLSGALKAIEGVLIADMGEALQNLQQKQSAADRNACSKCGWWLGDHAPGCSSAAKLDVTREKR